MNLSADLATNYDVAIIGAGPSGAVAASLLMKKGYRVAIFEKCYFPRFSIGESLLPHCMDFLEEAGMLDAVSGQAFQRKDGASFERENRATEFLFNEQFTNGWHYTYQVKRADFDKVLADEAERQGVPIFYGVSVENVSFDDSETRLSLVDENGVEASVVCRYLLDASGFGRVLPRLLDMETPSDFPVRTALFTHIKESKSDLYNRKNILITVHPEHQDIWYWLIPFSDGSASLGVVGQPAQFDLENLSNADCFESMVKEAPHLKQVLENSEIIQDVRKLEGYSADVKKLADNHFALLGNAGEFLDPVFSSGVTIALRSSSLAVNCVDKFLHGEPVSWMDDYEKPLRQGISTFKTFVQAWYDGRFQDIIFSENQDAGIRRMICSILAGYAWDTSNPYVAESERRVNVLAELCRAS